MMAGNRNNGKIELKNVRVVIRVRPLNKREQSEGYQNIVTVNREENVIALSKPNLPNEEPKTFKFDYIFPEDCTQMDLYRHVASPIVEKVLQGYNGTVFAYGQTGTGKTYTMVGKQNNNEHRGIIPNTFSHIFDQISVLSNEKTFAVTVTYLEIYNEDVRDLLSTNQNAKLEVRERLDGIYVKDLMEFTVDSIDSITELMNRGNNNRMTKSTLMNDVSSRSHAIFTISIESKDKVNRKTTIGKLNLVDLAGSERLGKTQATGERLKESSNINQSLSVLGNVISALINEKSTHIPFRNSKLTRLLQDSLGGNSTTAMIAMVGPSEIDYEESLCTLRYASRAKFIKNQVRVNAETKQGIIECAQQEVAKLQRWIHFMTLNENKTPLKSSEPSTKLTLLRSYDDYSSSVESRNAYLENQCTHLLEQLRNANQASIRQTQENASQINTLKACTVAQDERIASLLLQHAAREENLLRQIFELSSKHSSSIPSASKFPDTTLTIEESVEPKSLPSTDRGIQSMFMSSFTCQTDEHSIVHEEVSKKHEKLLMENEELKGELEKLKKRTSHLESINQYNVAEIHSQALLIQELYSDIHEGHMSNAAKKEEIDYLNHQLHLIWENEQSSDDAKIDYSNEIKNQTLEVIIQDLKDDAELARQSIDPQIFEERFTTLKARYDKDVKILENQIIQLNATLIQNDKKLKDLSNKFEELSEENMRMVSDNKTILDEKTVLRLEIKATKERLLATEEKLESTEDNLLDVNEELTRLERNNALNIEKTKEVCGDLQVENNKLVTQISKLKKAGEFFKNYYEDKIKIMLSAIGRADPHSLHKILSSRNKSKSESDLKECFTTAKHKTITNSLDNLCKSTTDLEYIYFTDLNNGLIDLKLLLEKSFSPELAQTVENANFENIMNKLNYNNKEECDIKIELTKANAKINELNTNCQHYKEVIDDLSNNKVNLEKLNWSLENRVDILIAEKDNVMQQLQTSKKKFEATHPDVAKVNLLKSELKKEKALFENKLHACRSERDMLLKTVADYSTKLQISGEANDSLNVDKKVLKQENDRIANQNKSLCLENSHLKTKIDHAREESLQMSAEILTSKQLANKHSELIRKLIVETDDLKIANDEYSKTIHTLREQNHDLQVKTNALELSLRNLKVEVQSTNDIYVLKMNGLKDEKRLLETKLHTALEELRIERSSHLKSLESTEADKRKLSNELTQLNEELKTKNKIQCTKIKSQLDDIIREKATVAKFKKELSSHRELVNKQEEIMNRLKTECAEIKNLKTELEFKDSEILRGLEKIKILSNTLEERGIQYRREQADIVSKLKVAEEKFCESLSNENRMRKCLQQSNSRIENFKTTINQSMNVLEYIHHNIQKPFSSLIKKESNVADMLSKVRGNLTRLVNDIGEQRAAPTATDAHQPLADLRHENELAQFKLKISELTTKYNDVNKELQLMKSKYECESSTSNKRKKLSPQDSRRNIDCQKCIRLTTKIYELEANMNSMTTITRPNDTLEFYRSQCDYQTKRIKVLEAEKQTLQAQTLESSKAQAVTDLENENSTLKDKYNKVKAIARLRLLEIQQLKGQQD